MAHLKVKEIRLCAMRNVDQTFCPKLLSAERTFDLLFSHFYCIKSYLSYLICSYMRRLAIQNSLKYTGTLQIFIDPHWYFILDTGLILRSIELFIYIQTEENINHYLAVVLNYAKSKYTHIYIESLVKYVVSVIDYNISLSRTTSS
jgi:hypothetical protein